MSDFDRKDWDQDSKGPENIESNRKEQDPDRYKEVTDAEKTIEIGRASCRERV